MIEQKKKNSSNRYKYARWILCKKEKLARYIGMDAHKHNSWTQNYEGFVKAKAIDANLL